MNLNKLRRVFSTHNNLFKGATAKTSEFQTINSLTQDYCNRETCAFLISIPGSFISSIDKKVTQGGDSCHKKKADRTSGEQVTNS